MLCAVTTWLVNGKQAGGRSTTVAELLRPGRPVLLDECGGMLIRPDGHVAWVADPETRDAALRMWTGP